MKAVLVLSIAGLLAAAGAAAAQDDMVAAGAKVFRKCQACHAIGEGATHRVGPQLNNLIGRQAGSLEDFPYSEAMKKAGEGGLVWSEETLAEYLPSPQAMVPGTKMVFPGLRKDEDVQSVIAFLKTHSDADAAGQSPGK